ncbi:hypothetical protein ACFXO9_25805 [Nocardia tengchongensis]|uniref:hypothetical protein n=1 Tax=Nocardia tengchongensis TaxID=2055889 RepID=UPI00368C70CB
MKTAGNERLILGTWDPIRLTSHHHVMSEVLETQLHRNEQSRSAIAHRLEQETADWLGAEDAVVLGSRDIAVQDLVRNLFSRSDVLLADPALHPGVVSHPFVESFRHNRPSTWQAAHLGSGGFGLLAAGVQPDSGGVVPLDQLFEALLGEVGPDQIVLDETRSIGVIGVQGRGAADLFGLTERISLRFMDFQRGLGGGGTCVVGPRRLVERIRERASETPPADELRTALACVLVARSPEGELLRERLRNNCAYLQGGLADIGLVSTSLGGRPGACDSPAVGVTISDVALASLWLRELDQRGVAAALGEWNGQFILSFLPTTAHSHEQLDHVIDVVSAVHQVLPR